MGNDLTRDYYRGFLIPDPRLGSSNIWDAESSYTQRGPLAGSITDDGVSNLILKSSGSITGAVDLNLRSMKSGYPTKEDSGFVWKKTTDSTTLYRGIDPPSIITQFLPVRWGNDFLYPDINKNKNNDLITVGYDSSSYTIFSYMYDKATSTWPSSASFKGTVADFSVAPYFNYKPTLVTLPSGRVLCYIHDDTVASYVQLDMYYTDDGITWVLGKKSILNTVINTSNRGASGAGTPGFDLDTPMCMEYKDGQILLIIPIYAHDNTLATRKIYAQYVSDDNGLNFYLIEQITGATTSESGTYFDIAVSNGKFVVAFNSYSTRRPTVKLLGNAADKITNQTSIDVQALVFWTTATGTQGDLCICSDESDTLYIYARAGNTDQICCSFISFDGGFTWEVMGEGSFSGNLYGKWWDTVTTTYPTNFKVCFHSGKVHLITNNVTGTTTGFTNGGADLVLGGYSQITMPPIYKYLKSSKQSTFSVSWVPFELPQNNSWTLNGTGIIVPSISSSGYLSMSTGVGNTKNYTIAPAAPSANSLTYGGIVKSTIQIPTSFTKTAANSEHVSIGLRVSDGAASYEAKVIFETTTGTISLIGAGAAQANIANAFLTTDWVEIILAVKNNKAFAYWRVEGNTEEDREWSTLSITGITNGAVATSRVEFGTVLALAGTSITTRWREMHFAIGDYIGLGMADTFVNPTNLFPKNYSVLKTYVSKELSITALAGPSFVGDTYTVTTQYEHNINNMFPEIEPSPRITWRSLLDGAIETVAWHFISGGDGTEFESSLLNSTYGIAWFNTNIRYAKLQYTTLATYPTWTDITVTGTPANAVLNGSADGLAINALRKGNTMLPNSTTSTRYVHTNELKGMIIETVAKHRIKSNTEGSLGTVANTQLARIFIDDYTIADDLLDSTVDNYNIVSPNSLSIIHFTQLPEDLLGFRLYIPSQTTVDGYYEIGTLMFGPIATFGIDYSFGKSTELQTNTELTTYKDGRRTSRVLGPTRKVIDFSWQEGVDVTQVQSTTDPDYIKNYDHANGNIIGTRFETPYQLLGTLDYLEGSNVPIVYISKFAAASKDDDVITYNRKDNYMLGRITSPITLTNVIGDENINEIITVGNIIIEEEI